MICETNQYEYIDLHLQDKDINKQVEALANTYATARQFH